MRIGVDLGGTKIEAIALADDGRELARRRVSTPSHDYGAVVAAVVRLVIDLEGAVGESGSVGVAMPGAISPATGLLKNSNTTALIGKPLNRDLAKALGRPVRLANDANCFVLSEATDGAAMGADVVFGVILGTGVGAGIVVHGALVGGPNAIAGEWGHNPLPWPHPDELPGPACYCGKAGCLETWLSGPALARNHGAATGVDMAGPAIASAAQGGDPGAVATLGRYHNRLARALATVINILDPDVVVLGGGLSNLASLYQVVPGLWGRYAFSDTLATRLVPARHGDSSGVRGAAWLWPPAA